MDHFSNVIFGQKVFLLSDSQEVLIMKRAGVQIFRGFWDIPGGKLEDTATLFEAIAREVHEEVGLKLTKIILTLTSSRFTGSMADKPLMFRNFYLGKAKGKIRLSSEHSEYKWVPVSELARYQFPPDADFQSCLARLPKIITKIDLQSPFSEIF